MKGSHSRYLRDMSVAHWVLDNLGPDAVCADVGAHTGEWLDYFRASAPNGRHLAFEALPDMAATLQQQYPEVEIFTAAAANHTGVADFVDVRNDRAWSGLRRQEKYFSEPGIEVFETRVVRFDDCLGDRARLDFMKIDVEGGELEVVQGAAEALARYRPLIYFEHARIHFFHYGPVTEPLFDALSAAGLLVYSLDRKQILDRDAFSITVRRAAEMDYAYPAETNFLAGPYDRLAAINLL